MIFNQNGGRSAVVQQQYESEVNNEYVIRGNSAIVKCSIPSFVADFVNVVSWHDESGSSFTIENSKDNGTTYKIHFGIHNSLPIALALPILIYGF